MKIENLSHPAVEVQLPLDGNSHQYIIPSDTTLFFWRALVPGARDRFIPPNSTEASKQRSLESKLRDQASWSISLDDEPISLMNELYRDSGYRGLSWWSATDAVELPAVLAVKFELTGDPPIMDGKPVVLWTDDGRKIPWGGCINSTIHLSSPTNQSHEFETHEEALWNRHRVYEPLREDS